MFEDSTFECNGKIRTHSRRWMIAAFLFNGSILMALILIPLIYPEALQRQMMTFLMEAPLPHAAPQPRPPQPAHVLRNETAVQSNPFAAPRTIPPSIMIPSAPEPATNIDIGSWTEETGVPGGSMIPTLHQPAMHVVRPAVKGPAHISSGVMAGLLIERNLPSYPPIARAARAEGTVQLAATISKAGEIENLRVVSGPPMLQQAALDAVRSWRYRPYRLNGDPVEVETTVNVIFTLGQ